MIYIALFRGINVGGKKILPMKELRARLEKLGARGVQTYIQSGNVVFTDNADEPDASWACRIRSAVERSHGFAPAVIVITPNTLQQVMADNPFPKGEAEPKTLHLGFLEKSPPEAKIDKLEQLRAGQERYQLTDQVFYLHAPDGIGKSKLAAGAENAIGVPMTIRNWNTALKLREMAVGLG